MQEADEEPKNQLKTEPEKEEEAEAVAVAVAALSLLPLSSPEEIGREGGFTLPGAGK